MVKVDIRVIEEIMLEVLDSYPEESEYFVKLYISQYIGYKSGDDFEDEYKTVLNELEDKNFVSQEVAAFIEYKVLVVLGIKERIN